MKQFIINCFAHTHTHIMSTSHRNSSRRSRIQRRLIPTLLSDGVRKSSLASFFALSLSRLCNCLDGGQKNVVVSNQISSTDAMYPSIGVWSSVYFLWVESNRRKKRNSNDESDMKVWCRIVKFVASICMYVRMTSSVNRERERKRWGCN